MKTGRPSVSALQNYSRVSLNADWIRAALDLRNTLSMIFSLAQNFVAWTCFCHLRGDGGDVASLLQASSIGQVSRLEEKTGKVAVNSGMGKLCGPFGFLIGAAKLEEIILIISK